MTRHYHEDLTGKIFGKLTVIKRSDDYISPQGKHHIRYLCICSCDEKNETLVMSHALTGNRIKSCGCGIKESTSKRMLKNLVDKKFGKLTVIKRIADRFDSQGIRLTNWLCQCDCGNFINVISNSLLRGNTKSCGCLHESFIASKLKEFCYIKYNSTNEYYTTISNEKNKHVYYDIFIPEYALFVEIHGEQHYEYVEFFHRNIETFYNSQLIDKIKKEYAEDNGFYLEVDLRIIKSTEEAIVLVVQKINEIITKNI